MRCRRRGGSISAFRYSAPTAWRYPRTSWAARRVPAPCCWRPEVATVAPLIAGGGQERGRRGGTPPLPAIAGFAAARDGRDRCIPPRAAARCGRGGGGRGGRRRVRRRCNRLANTTCLALPGVRADAQVIALDLDGIAVSAGAACSSGKVTASHVLAAMGLGPLAGQAIRVSLPWNATEAGRWPLRRCLPSHVRPAACDAGTTRRLNPHCPA